MATFVKNYSLTVNQYVAIEADDDFQAAQIFWELEHGKTSWFYLRQEVFDRMGEYVGNNVREVVYDIDTSDGPYRNDEFKEDAIDVERYLQFA